MRPIALALAMLAAPALAGDLPSAAIAWAKANPAASEAQTRAWIAAHRAELGGRNDQSVVAEMLALQRQALRDKAADAQIARDAAAARGPVIDGGWTTDVQRSEARERAAAAGAPGVTPVPKPSATPLRK